MTHRPPDPLVFSVHSACACNVTGSTRSWCDVTTGQCSCHDGVTGRQCDACQRYFFGFHAPPRGCSPCNCSQAYSVDLQCDVSGVCPCKPGVGGDKCVACRDGFYNLTGSGRWRNGKDDDDDENEGDNNCNGNMTLGSTMAGFTPRGCG